MTIDSENQVPLGLQGKLDLLDLKAGQNSSVSYHPKEYYTPFFSTLAKELQPGPIHDLFPLEKRPGVISLLAGKPNPATFPITSFTFTGRSLTDPSIEVPYTITGPALQQALQYADSAGFPQLLEWLIGLQETFHGRKKGEGWRLSVGCGSQDILYKALMTLVNDGDSVLIESPVYAGIIPIFRALHCTLVEIETDADGISAKSLREVMDTWPENKPRPRILYTVPYGCNPTGMTTTTERRIEVLKIARTYNLLILEDDPYYYLYFGSRSRPPSFFTLEVQLGGTVGNVLRFDSFSKILSGGIRIASVSGPEPIVRKIDMLSTISTLQAASLSQAVVYSLLSSWGYEGFRKHTEHVAQFYRAKRDIFETAMRKHLDGLVEWITPEAGMFIWFKLCLPPTANGDDGDSEVLIRTKAYENGVLALPGTVFLPNGRKSIYVRASFSLLEENEIDEALRRLAEVIRKEQLPIY